MNGNRTLQRAAIAWLLAAVATASGQVDEPASSLCAHAKAFRSTHLAGRPADPEIPAVRQVLREAMSESDVLHYDLDLEVLHATRSVQGSNTMTVKSLRDGLTQFSFRLRGNMTIAECVLNGGTAAACATMGTTGRVVTLDRPYNNGEVFTLKVSYSGAPARVDDAITFGTTSDGRPNIYTLSEPFGSSAWWPCKDVDYGEAGDNSDKATLDFAITVPEGLSATSNGVLVGVDELEGGRRRYHWSSTYPIATYLVAFAAANYVTWTKPFDYPGGSMPVVFNVYAVSDTPTRRANLEKVIGMLSTLSDAYGLYPFIGEKYGIYQFGWSGGMEHQTNTAQCCSADESLTVHELGHQWWGDDVTCRTWGDIWLNEGFATYTQALWAERKPGSSGFAALRSAMAGLRPGSVDGTIYRYDTSSFQSIFSYNYVYAKAAWVLHMLRGAVGDQSFFDTLAAYRNAYSGGSAATADFRDVASSVSGRDLTRFFDQWIFKGGAPSYASGSQNVTIAGKRYLRVHVRQTQSAGFGVDGYFAMPVTLRLGADASAPRARINNNARLQHYLLPVDAAVTSVALDPDEYILATNKSSEAYMAGPPKIVTTSPGPGDRVVTAAAQPSLSVVFSDNVAASPDAFGLTGPSGPVPFALAYDASTFTAILTFAGPLPAGDYMLTVSDSVKSVVGARALDGEVADPASPSSLPSGDGLAAGAAAIAFSILPPACAADVNADGLVNFADYLDFLNKYDASDLAVDFTHDGLVDMADYLEFLTLFEAGC